jgi:hypothetical protein
MIIDNKEPHDLSNEKARYNEYVSLDALSQRQTRMAHLEDRMLLGLILFRARLPTRLPSHQLRARRLRHLL